MGDKADRESIRAGKVFFWILLTLLLVSLAQQEGGALLPGAGKPEAQEPGAWEAQARENDRPQPGGFPSARDSNPAAPLPFDENLGMYGHSDHVGVSYRFAPEALARPVPVPAGLQPAGPAGEQAGPFPKEVVHQAPDSSDANAAIAADSEGHIWVAYTSFSGGGEDVFVRRRAGSGGWDTQTRLSSHPLADFHPAIAGGGRGHLWVVWSRQKNGRDWPLIGRHYDGRNWGPEQEIVSGKAYRPVLHAGSAGGEVWLAWEDWSSGSSRVRTAFWNGTRWSDPFPVGTAAPQQRPALAAGPDGTMYLVWDEVVQGRYDVRLAKWQGNNWNPFRGNIDRQWLIQPAPPRLEGHRRRAAAAVDREGRVWVLPETLVNEPIQLRRAFDGQDVFYNVRPPSRSMLVWTGSEWKGLPPGPLLSGKAPSLHIDRHGTVWILTRTPGPGTRDFLVVGQRYRGGQWFTQTLASPWSPGQAEDPAMVIAPEVGSIKEPVSLLESGDELWVARHETHRVWTDQPAWTYADGPVDTVVYRLPLEASSHTAPRLAELDPSHHGTASPDVTPVPDYRLQDPAFSTVVSGDRMQLFYGDLHHHSEYSRDPGVLNGDLESNYRYVRDIRGLDFFGPTDHVEHLNEADWYRIRRAAAFYNEAAFTSFTGFEWTSEFYRGGNLQTGHHNVIYRTDGPEVRPYSASRLESNTPLGLTRLIERDIAAAQNRGIGADAFLVPHDPNRSVQPLGWSWYNPRVRLMEIVQSRGSHELLGGPSKLPLRNDIQQVMGHSVQDGLERGFRWGFIGSGDHFGRPLAGVLAPQRSREALFDSLSAKRTFATSGARMVVDVSVDGHPMGSEWRGGETSHQVKIYARGTRPLTLLELWKNGRLLYRWNPDPQQEEFQIDYVDLSASYLRENWWYVRVTQEDGEMAWSSPLWFVYEAIQPQVIVDAGRRQPVYVMPQFPVPIPVLMRNQRAEPVSGQMRLLNVPAGWRLEPDGPLTFELAPESWSTQVWEVQAAPESIRELKTVPIELETTLAGGQPQRIPMVVVQSPQLLNTRGQLDELNDALHLQQDPAILDQWLKVMSRRWGLEGSR